MFEEGRTYIVIEHTMDDISGHIAVCDPEDFFVPMNQWLCDSNIYIGAFGPLTLEQYENVLERLVTLGELQLEVDEAVRRHERAAYSLRVFAGSLEGRDVDA